MGITIRDVAKASQTSTATVSKVINGHPSISQETAKRVMEVVKTLHYVPNKNAQIFAGKRTNNIAFVTTLERNTAFINPHMYEIMAGLQQYLGKRGYSVTVYGNPAFEPTKIENLIQQKSIDGIVLHASVLTPELSRLIKRLNFPHVIIGMPNFPNDLCWIDNNNLLSSQMAAHHILGLGRERIAFVGGHLKDAISESRLQGVLTEFKEHQMTLLDTHIQRGESTPQEGVRMMNQLLSRTPLPNAVICANNSLALGCLNAIKERGLKVPDDIALITFDDYPYALITQPPLTSVSIDVYDLGTQGAKMILEKIKHPNLQFQTFITLPILAIRESTKVI